MDQQTNKQTNKRDAEKAKVKQRLWSCICIYLRALSYTHFVCFLIRTSNLGAEAKRF